MTVSKQKRVAIIGCGNISKAYLNATKTFSVLDIVACADINNAAAQATAKEWNIKACSIDELLSRDDIDIILNLTIPQAHAEVSLKALNAGKHVYLEKPLALDREEGREVVARAAELGLRLACAPDTILGAGVQTARKLVDDGVIGRVVAGTAFMMCPGHESWHPNPAFYYAKGGGPVFDMAPYYLSALITMLGPVRQVSAFAAKTFAERMITSEAKYGEMMPVEVPTHVSGSLLFDSGALISLVMSFDVFKHSSHPIELHGERGSMQVPDPNTFGGEVAVSVGRNAAWEPYPLINDYTENMRGIGLADLAFGLLADRKHRCHSDMAFHVLDVMQALHESAEQEKHIDIQSTCERPSALPLGVSGGDLGDSL